MISGTALDKPPAPISCIETIGVSLPSELQWLMTSWQRRSISGFSRCTEAKSKSSEPDPEACEEAAPPPKPMSIAGPPKIIIKEPGGITCLSINMGRILPMPPAIIMGLW